MLCVEMIRRFVDHNYEEASTRGPTVLYCAPSNKAVNVGACTYVNNMIQGWRQLSKNGATNKTLDMEATVTVRPAPLSK